MLKQFYVSVDSLKRAKKMAYMTSIFYTVLIEFQHAGLLCDMTDMTQFNFDMLLVPGMTLSTVV